GRGRLSIRRSNSRRNGDRWERSCFHSPASAGAVNTKEMDDGSSRRSQFTRREVLATMLGLPAALAACRSGQPPPPLPAGEIVGASDLIGHRIRDGLRVSPSADQWERVGVVIVGGGIAGLSAAWQLLRAGFEDF